ncbi:MAG: DNA phosphorothioation system sulfurtransferase DndC [Cyanobacteria bacterium J06639_14]
MVAATDNLSPGRSVTELLADVEALTAEIQALYTLDDIPWIVGYSGGKDSSATLQLVWNAIAALPRKECQKPIHVISTDTRVENPIISAWVKESQKQIKAAARRRRLPFEPKLLIPEIKDTFWVNLIGKGYPAPRRKFRWCTERLKIRPSNTFIREQVRASGETILVLGTRKSESSKRAHSMAKHARRRIRDRLSPNAALPNSLIYSPIEDWSDQDVWLYLHTFPNPWSTKGKNLNKDLFQIYRGATADNDCPLVVDTSTPSCGGSRFGCWVCTLVDKDKSMEAMILNDDEKSWMEPLLDLRDELDFRTDEKRQKERANRDFRRMSGRVELFEHRGDNGEPTIAPIPGPYIKAWREELLRKVLTTQEQVRQLAPYEMKTIELISQEELLEIRRIWREDKHEFDDSLPRIYYEVTGQRFQDPRPTSDTSHLGSDEWAILQDLCGDDPLYLELITKLLDTERKFHTKSHRTGIYKELAACFETSALPKAAAIQQAEAIRDMKQAQDQSDLPAFQNAWAKVKFGQPPQANP